MTPAVVWRGLQGSAWSGSVIVITIGLPAGDFRQAHPHPHSARQAGRLYVGFVVGLIPSAVLAGDDVRHLATMPRYIGLP